MIRLAALSFIIIHFLIGCANQSSPTGGPTDKTPPELKSSVPTDNQKNYTGKTIELTFDENIKLKDPKDEILITPGVGKKTKFTAKGKKLIIEPELPWAENTTYSISFREGVQDITEGNPAENLQLAFSTGATIDSLKITGEVSQTFKQDVPDKITVAIYQSDTFDIFSHAPTYFTFADKKGKFTIKNLKAGSFFIYAFEDKNKNLKIESKAERFTFLKHKVNSGDTTKIKLALIRVDARPLKLTTIRNTSKISSIRFNKELEAITLKGLKNDMVNHFGSSKNELMIYHNLAFNDSIRISISAKDSVNQKLDTAVYIKNTNAKYVNVQYKANVKASRYSIADKEFQATLIVNKPSKLNLDSIYFSTDSTSFESIKKESYGYDTINNTIFIKTALPKQDSTKPGKKPVIQFSKGSLISIEKDTLKGFEIPTTELKEDQTGTLLIEIDTKQNSYIIQLLRDDNSIVESLPNIKKYTFNYLEPKTYKIQIILDENKNGKWDAGNFYQKIEPEKVIIYKNSEGSSSIPMRANWEQGPLKITF